MFTLLPAIDLTHGRLGVYAPDGPRPLGVFGGDPSAAAEAFARSGARWLHVVDMDLAFTGEAVNVGTIAAIHGTHPDVSLQCAGGVRDRATIERMFLAGASRVVVGSAALVRRDELAQDIADLGDRLMISVEVGEGRIRSRGRDPVDLDLMSELGWLTAAGARGFVVTTIARVGTGDGPDVEVVKRVARTGVPTIAAGGIASIADLNAVRRAGAVGAVVGYAAMDGSLDLAEAFEWTRVPG